MTEEQSPGKIYQQLLLATLGDADPVEVQTQTADLMRQLLADAGEHLRTPPAPGEFSVAQLLGHLLDAELVSATRYRWILAEHEPAMPGYEQDDWVRVSGYADADPNQLIEVFSLVRKVNLDLWRHTSPAERDRVGNHSERGPESYELTFRLIAGHDLVHLEQARKTIAAVKAGAAGS